MLVSAQNIGGHILKSQLRTGVDFLLFIRVYDYPVALHRQRDQLSKLVTPARKLHNGLWHTSLHITCGLRCRSSIELGSAPSPRAALFSRSLLVMKMRLLTLGSAPYTSSSAVQCIETDDSRPKSHVAIPAHAWHYGGPAHWRGTKLI